MTRLRLSFLVVITATTLVKSEPVGHCPPEDSWTHAELLPDDRDCEIFYKCQSGTATAIRCRYELRFNVRLQVCDWPWNVPYTVTNFPCEEEPGGMVAAPRGPPHLFRSTPSERLEVYGLLPDEMTFHGEEPDSSSDSAEPGIEPETPRHREGASDEAVRHFFELSDAISELIWGSEVHERVLKPNGKVGSKFDDVLDSLLSISEVVKKGSEDVVKYTGPSANAKSSAGHTISRFLKNFSVLADYFDAKRETEFDTIKIDEIFMPSSKFGSNVSLEANRTTRIEDRLRLLEMGEDASNETEEIFSGKQLLGTVAEVGENPFGFAGITQIDDSDSYDAERGDQEVRNGTDFFPDTEERLKKESLEDDETNDSGSILFTGDRMGSLERGEPASEEETDEARVDADTFGGEGRMRVSEYNETTKNEEQENKTREENSDAFLLQDRMLNFETDERSGNEDQKNVTSEENSSTFLLEDRMRSLEEDEPAQDTSQENKTEESDSNASLLEDTMINLEFDKSKENEAHENQTAEGNVFLLEDRMQIFEEDEPAQDKTQENNSEENNSNPSLLEDRMISLEFDKPSENEAHENQTTEGTTFLLEDRMQIFEEDEPAQDKTQEHKSDENNSNPSLLEDTMINLEFDKSKENEAHENQTAEGNVFLLEDRMQIFEEDEPAQDKTQENNSEENNSNPSLLEDRMISLEFDKPSENETHENQTAEGTTFLLEDRMQIFEEDEPAQENKTEESNSNASLLEDRMGIFKEDESTSGNVDGVDNSIEQKITTETVNTFPVAEREIVSSEETTTESLDTKSGADSSKLESEDVIRHFEYSEPGTSENDDTVETSTVPLKLQEQFDYGVLTPSTNEESYMEGVGYVPTYRPYSLISSPEYMQQFDSINTSPAFNDPDLETSFTDKPIVLDSDEIISFTSSSSLVEGTFTDGHSHETQDFEITSTPPDTHFTDLNGNFNPAVAENTSDHRNERQTTSGEFGKEMINSLPVEPETFYETSSESEPFLHSFTHEANYTSQENDEVLAVMDTTPPSSDDERLSAEVGHESLRGDSEGQLFPTMTSDIDSEITIEDQYGWVTNRPRKEGLAIMDTTPPSSDDERLSAEVGHESLKGDSEGQLFPTTTSEIDSEITIEDQYGWVTNRPGKEVNPYFEIPPERDENVSTDKEYNTNSNASSPLETSSFSDQNTEILFDTNGSTTYPPSLEKDPRIDTEWNAGTDSDTGFISEETTKMVNSENNLIVEGQVLDIFVKESTSSPFNTMSPNHENMTRPIQEESLRETDTMNEEHDRTDIPSEQMAMKLDRVEDVENLNTPMGTASPTVSPGDMESSLFFSSENSKNVSSDGINTDGNLSIDLINSTLSSEDDVTPNSTEGVNVTNSYTSNVNHRQPGELIFHDGKSVTTGTMEISRNQNYETLDQFNQDDSTITENFTPTHEDFTTATHFQNYEMETEFDDENDSKIEPSVDKESYSVQSENDSQTNGTRDAHKTDFETETTLDEEGSVDLLHETQSCENSGGTASCQNSEIDQLSHDKNSTTEENVTNSYEDMVRVSSFENSNTDTIIHEQSTIMTTSSEEEINTDFHYPETDEPLGEHASTMDWIRTDSRDDREGFTSFNESFMVETTDSSLSDNLNSFPIHRSLTETTPYPTEFGNETNLNRDSVRITGLMDSKRADIHNNDSLPMVENDESSQTASVRKTNDQDSDTNVPFAETSTEVYKDGGPSTHLQDTEMEELNSYSPTVETTTNSIREVVNVNDSPHSTNVGSKEESRNSQEIPSENSSQHFPPQSQESSLVTSYLESFDSVTTMVNEIETLAVTAEDELRREIGKTETVDYGTGSTLEPSQSEWNLSKADGLDTDGNEEFEDFTPTPTTTSITYINLIETEPIDSNYSEGNSATKSPTYIDETHREPTSIPDVLGVEEMINEDQSNKPDISPNGTFTTPVYVQDDFTLTPAQQYPESLPFTFVNDELEDSTPTPTATITYTNLLESDSLDSQSSEGNYSYNSPGRTDDSDLEPTSTPDELGQGEMINDDQSNKIHVSTSIAFTTPVNVQEDFTLTLEHQFPESIPVTSVDEELEDSTPTPMTTVAYINLLESHSLDSQSGEGDSAFNSPTHFDEYDHEPTSIPDELGAEERINEDASNKPYISTTGAFTTPVYQQDEFTFTSAEKFPESLPFTFVDVELEGSMPASTTTITYINLFESDSFLSSSREINSTTNSPPYIDENNVGFQNLDPTSIHYDLLDDITLRPAQQFPDSMPVTFVNDEFEDSTPTPTATITDKSLTEFDSLDSQSGEEDSPTNSPTFIEEYDVGLRNVETTSITDDSGVEEMNKDDQFNNKPRITMTVEFTTPVNQQDDFPLKPDDKLEDSTPIPTSTIKYINLLETDSLDSQSGEGDSAINSPTRIDEYDFEPTNIPNELGAEERINDNPSNKPYISTTGAFTTPVYQQDEFTFMSAEQFTESLPLTFVDEELEVSTPTPTTITYINILESESMESHSSEANSTTYSKTRTDDSYLEPTSSPYPDELGVEERLNDDQANKPYISTTVAFTTPGYEQDDLTLTPARKFPESFPITIENKEFDDSTTTPNTTIIYEYLLGPESLDSHSNEEDFPTNGTSVADPMDLGSNTYDDTSSEKYERENFTLTPEVEIYLNSKTTESSEPDLTSKGSIEETTLNMKELSVSSQENLEASLNESGIIYESDTTMDPLTTEHVSYFIVDVSKASTPDEAIEIFPRNNETVLPSISENDTDSETLAITIGNSDFMSTDTASPEDYFQSDEFKTTPPAMTGTDAPGIDRENLGLNSEETLESINNTSQDGDCSTQIPTIANPHSENVSLKVDADDDSYNGTPSGNNSVILNTVINVSTIGTDPRQKTNDVENATTVANDSTASLADGNCFPRRWRTFPKNLPHITDCGLYFQCVSGRPTLRHCPVGLHFSRFSGRCDVPHRARCAPHNKDDDRLCPPEVNVDRRCGDCSRIGPRFPHPEDCSRYLLCQRGTVNEHRCRFGMHFNEMVAMCDFPFRACCSPKSRLRPMCKSKKKIVP